MTITYEVCSDGHVILAVASGTVTPEEFVEYELIHATDDRIKSPVSELFAIRPGALAGITKSDIEEVIRRRKEQPNAPTSHRCAIVVSSGDSVGWDMAQFYAGMARLHYPKNVIVFGDERTARIWLGIADTVKR